jgi:hypothetical protein
VVKHAVAESEIEFADALRAKVAYIQVTTPDFAAEKFAGAKKQSKTGCRPKRP